MAVVVFFLSYNSPGNVFRVIPESSAYTELTWTLLSFTPYQWVHQWKLVSKVIVQCSKCFKVGCITTNCALFIILQTLLYYIIDATKCFDHTFLDRLIKEMKHWGFTVCTVEFILNGYNCLYHQCTFNNIITTI